MVVIVVVVIVVVLLVVVVIIVVVVIVIVVVVVVVVVLIVVVVTVVIVGCRRCRSGQHILAGRLFLTCYKQTAEDLQQILSRPKRCNVFDGVSGAWMAFWGYG